MSRQHAAQVSIYSVSLHHSTWCHALPVDNESVSLPELCLVKAGLSFAIAVHVLSVLDVCYLFLMCLHSLCTWLPGIAYRGLCATSSETLLTASVGSISPDQGI